MLSVGLNLKPFFIGGFTPTDPNAAIFIEAAGYQDNDLKQIIDNVFLSIKALNSGATYDKISLMRIYATDSTNNTTSLNQCLLNAVNPATYLPTLISNNPTANYSGISYDGINQFHQCGYNPITDPKWGLNSATQINYVYNPNNTYIVTHGQRNNSIATNRNMFQATQGTPSRFLATGINDATAGVVFSAIVGDSSGFIAGCRNAANNTKYYFMKNTMITQTGAIPNGVPNLDLPFGAYSLDGGTTKIFLGAQRHQFDLFGSGFTTSELSSLETIVNNLQGSLDTIFGLTGTSTRKRY
jgi:hypothetical protein